MIHVDGSQQLGSGTIVRFAVALSALLGRPLHLSNARAKRAKPGLRPQHVTALRACAEICDATTQGVEVGSSELRFTPGSEIRGGTFDWDIGTAGSATMLALGILPVACLASSALVARITGGVFQDFAPSPYHIEHVLCPLLARMGVEVELRVLIPGYVPRGRGRLELRVRPAAAPLKPLRLIEPGIVERVSGIALSSHLEERRVSERMAEACEARLGSAGLPAHIERIYDDQAARPGAGLAVWAQSSTGCLLGADRAGAPRRSSEAIGRSVADSLVADLHSGATADLHLADQLVLFGAVADGTTRYIAPRLTDHLRTNLWLARLFGAEVRHGAQDVEIEGLALVR